MLEIWTEKAFYNIGDQIEIFFKVKEPLYVEILDLTPEGEITRLFPNTIQADNHCLPGRVYRIPPENGDFDLIITPPTGVDRIKAIASFMPPDDSNLVQTRGIQFTKKIINSSATRVNLKFSIQPE